MGRREYRLALLLALLLYTADLQAQPNPEPLIVHEWGTFTSLQNEAGQAIGGINTDDEPVPQFVHRLTDGLLISPTEVPAIFFKGAPSCHPDVTLRLETPVLYFHLPGAWTRIPDVSVTAQFRGGWLTEFYPNALADAPGVANDPGTFGALRSDTVSTLAWNNLDVGGEESGPPSDEHVWTAPRAVRAAALRTPGGEAEKFLFYRGVGHIDAPIMVARNPDTSELTLRSHLPRELAGEKSLQVKSAWLVDVDAYGAVAFRVLPALRLGGTGTDKVLLRVSGNFAPSEYNEANREQLRSSLHRALVAEGLFDDEARALLDTWELSYFKSAGMRVFFLVPRAWTDLYLALSVSKPAQITRVMVGRLELVTPQQRSNLQQIAQMPATEITAEANRLLTDYNDRIGSTSPEQFRQVTSGRQSLEGYGISVPRSYQLYLALGRFRNALILEEVATRPTPGLETFVSDYALAGYPPVESSAAAH
jgi:hypothetical protein